MAHGGYRKGSGRTAINGKEIKIKLSNDIYEQLEINFTGKTHQERIRECLEYGISQKQCSHSYSDKDTYTVIDLFSGAGGLSRGFMDAGFSVKLGIDFDDAALKTFSENHGNTDIMKLDLFNHDNINKIVEYVRKNNLSIDVLIGGPPCQGFSLAGKREEFDKRNVLYSAMVKTAQKIKPKVVILENVPGMLTLYNGAGAKRVREDFERIGYNVATPKILYAPEYGVPQIRRRVFFVMTLKNVVNKKFEYPESELNEADYISCEQAINDLPSLNEVENFNLNQTFDYATPPTSIYQEIMRGNSKEVINHIPTNHTKETIKLISLVPEGKNYKSLPETILSKRKFKYNEALTRYHSKKPSRTIDTGHRTHFHYKWNRIPTVRENARLQSFPDDFVFFGNKQEQYRQVGNAVPPLLGKAIAKKVKEVLN
ncbi:DNA cytosine methyltransferase [Staphylococcus simulans]|uniref:DNA cytosine methyltransferase n=1 Tax=Staphylococcus simulans TaxID=1286 RepID=UPI000D031783|nr:DNA cytosine methyltransferase [Staphylococcus simulans]PTJ01365.1 DNA cytosine methyltransferase [Staphylococcus simulans]PTJ16646.1 DNA cytosine methyltransferase [Staphylococcus simulans]PTJ82203.1 DNA cytosine methyltransferase [Staphylococcus simulans]